MSQQNTKKPLPVNSHSFLGNFPDASLGFLLRARSLCVYLFPVQPWAKYIGAVWFSPTKSNCPYNSPSEREQAPWKSVGIVGGGVVELVLSYREIVRVAGPRRSTILPTCSRPMDLASLPAYCWASSHSSSLGPCSEHLGNSQKVLKHNDLWDCRFVSFNSEKLQPLCRAKLSEEWGAPRRHAAVAGKDVLLRESAQIWWSGSEGNLEREVAKLCVSNVSGPAATLKVTAFAVFMQCSLKKKKSALILFTFNQ